MPSACLKVVSLYWPSRHSRCLRFFSDFQVNYCGFPKEKCWNFQGNKGGKRGEIMMAFIDSVDMHITFPLLIHTYAITSLSYN